MKNFSSILVCACLFLFASCSKEGLVEPVSGLSIEERSTTIELPVAKVSYSDDGVNLTVSFSGNYDFTQAVLETTQHLDFEDSNGNSSILTFSVVSNSGSNGALQAVFSIGSNNLAGLDLADVQEIIIEDEQFE